MKEKRRKTFRSYESTKGSEFICKKQYRSSTQFVKEEPVLEDPLFHWISKDLKEPKVENDSAEEFLSLNVEHASSVTTEDKSSAFNVDQNSLAVSIQRAPIKHELLCDGDLYEAEHVEHIESKFCVVKGADLRSCQSNNLLERVVDAGEFAPGESNSLLRTMEGSPVKLLADGGLKMEKLTSFGAEFPYCSLNEVSTQFIDLKDSNFIDNIPYELANSSDGSEPEMKRSSPDETLCCSLNEASTEYREDLEGPTYFTADADLSGESSDELSEFNDVRGLEIVESSANNELTACSDNASTHYLVPCISSFLQDIIDQLFSCFLVSSEILGDRVLASEYSADLSEKISVLNALRSEVNVNERSFSCLETLSDLPKNIVDGISYVVTDGSLKSMEANDECFECISGLESGVTDDEVAEDCKLKAVHCKDASLNLEYHSTTVADNHNISPQGSEHFVRASSHTGLAMMDSSDNFLVGDPKHPPKKLLSTRKAISPPSQMKLCQAITNEKLYECMLLSNYRRKKWFEKQTKASMTKAVNKEADMMNCDGITENVKTNINGSLPFAGDVHMSSRASYKESSTCNRCSWNNSNAQKAIKFSHHQMHDMECFVMKVMGDLKSMKLMFEENLSSRSFSVDSSSKGIFKEKMRKAYDYAVRLEDTARMWRSVLERDLRRFSNIMAMPDNVFCAPNIHKRQKEVRFADEIGGVLCEVEGSKNPTFASQ